MRTDFRVRLQPIVMVGVFGIASISLTSCGKKDEIRVTEVPKDLSALEGQQFQIPGGFNAATGNNPAGSSTLDTPASGEASRILAAMISRPEATYFLKTQAPVSQVASIEADFRAIAKSLTFDNDSLQWTLPDAWTESVGGAMFRIATLKSPSGGEIFVTSLTAGQDLLSNVNRWQGQVGLPPVTPEDLSVERLQVGAQEVILYDQTGPAASTSMTGAPFAAASSTNSDLANPPAAADEKAVTPGQALQLPEMTAPWESLGPTSTAFARWELREGEAVLELKVFKFPAGMDFLSMVGIWTGAAGLPAATAESFGAATQKVTVAGTDAVAFTWPNDLAENSEPAGGKAMKIIRIDQGADAFYLKVEGPRELLSKHLADFQTFVDGVRLTQ